MILLTFQTPGGLQLGIKTDAGVIDVMAAGAALGVDVPASPDDYYAAGLDGTKALAGLVEKAEGAAGDWLLDESELTYGPCVPNPGQDYLCWFELPSPCG